MSFFFHVPPSFFNLRCFSFFFLVFPLRFFSFFKRFFTFVQVKRYRAIRSVATPNQPTKVVELVKAMLRHWRPQQIRKIGPQKIQQLQICILLFLFLFLCSSHVYLSCHLSLISCLSLFSCLSLLSSVSLHPPSFRVCKVNPATLKVATN